MVGTLRFAHPTNPRNDCCKCTHTFAIPRRDSPEFCRYFRATRKKRARGMPDARCTRGLVCKIVRRNAHEHTGSAEAIRHSLRNGFTAYSALSPATNSFCHRHRRISGFAGPGWANKTSADLAPATGARTTRLHRTPQRRSSGAPLDRSRTPDGAALRLRCAPDAAASTASRPALMTIAKRPSSGRDGERYTFDLPVGMNRKISLRCKKMTRQRNHWIERVICPSGRRATQRARIRHGSRAAVICRSCPRPQA
jgi:hypothetical protein